ncbi:hypothetical protein D3C76_1471240 [compost metagenome]
MAAQGVGELGAPGRVVQFAIVAAGIGRCQVACSTVGILAIRGGAEVAQVGLEHAGA